MLVDGLVPEIIQLIFLVPKAWLLKNWRVTKRGVSKIMRFFFLKKAKKQKAKKQKRKKNGARENRFRFKRLDILEDMFTWLIKFVFYFQSYYLTFQQALFAFLFTFQVTYLYKYLNFFLLVSSQNIENIIISNVWHLQAWFLYFLRAFSINDTSFSYKKGSG